MPGSLHLSSGERHLLTTLVVQGILARVPGLEAVMVPAGGGAFPPGCSATPHSGWGYVSKG